MENMKSRSLLVIFGLLITVVWLVPNFINSDKSWWFTKQKLNYGLDIQGGLHLVMGVDIDGVLAEHTHRLVGALTEDLKKTGLEVEIIATNLKLGEVTITSKKPDQMEKIEKYFSDFYGTRLQQMEKKDQTLIYRYFEAHLLDYKNKVIEQSIETLRNRIDQFGVAEPVIAKQGDNRILIQLPGIKNAESAKQLINTTAKLDFMIVSETKSHEELRALIATAEKTGNYSLSTLKYADYIQKINEDLKDKIPEKTMILLEKSPTVMKMELGFIPYLVELNSGLSGDTLDDANLGFDNYGNPIVSIRFNAAGSLRFAEVSGNNVGRRMAIVLDKVIKSAPNLKERIGGGQAQISFGGKDTNVTEEAKMIAMALRAGALPASLEQLEERNVGPTLGKDSVDGAKMASMIGSILIAIFMIVYYKSMGLIADIVLGVNVMMILALLSSFGATLTLPGIAGIALTIGMAVDANVLINERLREELHRGISFKIAIKDAYEKSFTAILDSNLTTAATGVVLLYFGTGPVRGFAVTLLIGIFTTLFTNVFMSKYVVEFLMHKMHVKKLSV